MFTNVIRGIAVRMTWDGKRYIRGDDILLWSDSEAGRKYTPDEFVRPRSSLASYSVFTGDTETILDHLDGEDRIRGEHEKEFNHRTGW